MTEGEKKYLIAFVELLIRDAKRDSLDSVLEIIDSSIEDVEAYMTGKEGAVSEERKVGMLLEAKAIRICIENLKGGEQE